MRRCRICDQMYNDSNSFAHRLDPTEDTCKVCEDSIVETLMEMEEDDETQSG